MTDRKTKTHRRGRSKRSDGQCRRRTEIPEAERLTELSVGKDRGSITQPRDPGCLAHPGVGQVECSLPAVSLVVLSAGLDPVAVRADGRGEALVEGLALAPELPLAVADAHLVDAAAALGTAQAR